MVKVSVAQGDRVEEQTAAMSRRILSDLNRLRVEASGGETAAVVAEGASSGDR
jgi:hypothetical protein